MLRRATQLILIPCLGLSVSSCAVMMAGQGHEWGSGQLSDAAAQAHPDSMRKYKVPPPDVGYTVPPSVEVVVENESTYEPGFGPGTETGMSPPAARAARIPQGRRLPVLASIVAGGGTLGGTDYDGFSTVGIALGGYPSQRTRVDVLGTINGVNFKGEGLLGEAFKNAAELSLDLTVRYYLTEDHTLMGFYPEAGIGTGTLFWDYARPVTVIENDAPKTLSDDRLNYFSLFGGAGVSLLQTRYGGVRFYGWHSKSGLENNMLKTTGYLKGLVEVSFRVGSS